MAVLFVSCGFAFGQGLNEGLVAYYPFNGNAEDESGNNRHLSTQGQPTFEEGINGLLSAQFDDNADGFEITGQDTPSNTGAASVSVWFEQDDPSGSQVVVGVTRTAISRFYIYLANGLIYYQHGMERGGRLEGGVFENQPTLSNGWNNFVLTTSGNGGKLSGYLNGQFLGDVSAGINLTGLTDYQVGALTELAPADQYRQAFRGRIQNLRIYNRSLSEQEVTTLYALESQNNQFQIIEGNFTWQEAKADAEARGGRLAVLDTQEKIESSRAHLFENPGWPNLWIGLTDEVQEGEWKWITGEYLGTATNWWRNSPDNFLPTEDYAIIYREDPLHNNGEWADVPSFGDGIGYGYLLEILGPQPQVMAGLYGLDHTSDELVKIDIETGAVSTVGPLGIDVGASTGLDYDPSSGLLITSIETNSDSVLYEINLNTGLATIFKVIPKTGDANINQLGFAENGTLYAWNERAGFTRGDLWTVDISDGTFTKIGNSSLPSVVGADYQEGSGFWVSDEWEGRVYKLNETTAQIELTGPAIWYTGNGPGDLFDMDFGYDGLLRVAASDSTLPSVLLTINQEDGSEISRVTLSREILGIASVPYSDRTPAVPFVAIDPFYESPSGEAVVIDATPTAGFPAEFTYQWCFNGFKIPANLGGTASSINIDNLQANEGTWSVTVTNETGSVEQSFEYRIYADTDSDGLSDAYEELVSLTNINNPDTDNDGLIDSEEVNTYRTNPNSSDSDSDGFTDLYELETANDPNSAESTPDGQVNIMTAIEVDFNAALGATYEIQFSTDTIEWTVIEAGIVGEGNAVERL